MTHLQTPPQEHTKGRTFELTAIVFTAAGKVVLGDVLGFDLFYIVVACAFWIGYVFLTIRWQPNVRARWGFTHHGMATAARLNLPFAVLSIGGFIVYGVTTNNAAPSWNTVFMLILYPIWGIIQQFMVVALLADNVRALSKDKVPIWLACLIGATLFALIHIPVYPLVFATFALGLMTTISFFRTRNMWIPGILHGWYATVFYVFVMGQDPLGAMLGPLGL